MSLVSPITIKKIKFAVTPSEFEMLFEGLPHCFIFTNKRVDITKMYSNEDFFKAYKNLFEKIPAGQTEINLSEKQGRLEYNEITRFLPFSIIDDKAKIEYKAITDEKGNASDKFRTIIYKEPVMHILPFYLSITPKLQLSLSRFNQAGIFGLEMWYPATAYYRKNEQCEFEEIIKTENFCGSQLFDEIAARIKKIAHKAKITSEEKTYKPDFWISKEAAAQTTENKFLNANGLRLQ